MSWFVVSFGCYVCCVLVVYGSLCVVSCCLRCLVYVLFLATCYVFGVVLGAVSC